MPCSLDDKEKTLMRAYFRARIKEIIEELKKVRSREKELEQHLMEIVKWARMTFDPETLEVQDWGWLDYNREEQTVEQQ
jgi:hypothetical protein